MKRAHWWSEWSALTMVTLLALVLGVAACGGEPASDETGIDVTEEDLAEVARGIHERVLTVDTHDDIPFDFATPEVDPGEWGERQVTLPKMREGGLDVGFFIVYVGQGELTPQGYEDAYQRAMIKFDAIHRMAEMYPEEIEIAHSAADVERIHDAGKLVAAIGIENGWPVGMDLDNLATFHERGGRYITLAHNGHNQIADSANPRSDEPESMHDGISEFGAEVIAEMNRLGIMVDVSHVSKAAMLEAVQLSEAPVIASHSSCRALCDVSRNMDDEQLRVMADSGGVVQIVALGAFVEQTPERDQAMRELLSEVTGYESRRELFQALSEAGDDDAELQEMMAEFQRRVEEEIDPVHPAPDVDDFVDHIDHAVEVMGIDHVGISSDFDGGGGVVGWNDASETFNVTLELVERGYSEEEIAQIWGGNTLRVWREVEQVAERLQAGQGAGGSQ